MCMHARIALSSTESARGCVCKARALGLLAQKCSLCNAPFIWLMMCRPNECVDSQPAVSHCVGLGTLPVISPDLGLQLLPVLGCFALLTVTWNLSFVTWCFEIFFCYSGNVYQVSASIMRCVIWARLALSESCEMASQAK